MAEIAPSGKEGIRMLVGFHDGYLTGIKSGSDQALVIWCVASDNTEYALCLPKPKLLRLNSFTGANIINAILMYEARVCPKALYAEVSQFDPNASELVLHSRFIEFGKTDDLLIHIATSDGCSLSCLCSGPFEAIEVRPTN